MHSDADATYNLPDSCDRYVRFLTDTPQTFVQTTSIKLSQCFSLLCPYRQYAGTVSLHPSIVHKSGNVCITLWCNYCCGGRALSITYSECMFVALCSMQCECAMLYWLGARLAVLYYVPTLSHKRQFSKKIIEHKMCILIFSTTFVRNISQSKKNSSEYYQKYTYLFMWTSCYSCKNWKEYEFSPLISWEYSDVEFHENSSSGSQVVLWGWTDGRTGIKKLKNFVHNFAKAANNIIAYLYDIN
jgi:hypothetical protein